MGGYGSRALGRHSSNGGDQGARFRRGRVANEAADRVAGHRECSGPQRATRAQACEIGSDRTSREMAADGVAAVAAIILEQLPARAGSAAGCRTGEAGQPSVESIGLHRDDVESHARSEEHTSELQSLMRSSYAVLCLKKKIKIRL